MKLVNTIKEALDYLRLGLIEKNNKYILADLLNDEDLDKPKEKRTRARTQSSKRNPWLICNKIATIYVVAIVFNVFYNILFIYINFFTKGK